MRKILPISLLLLCTIGFGQNDIVFSHYMINPVVVNPAFVGIDETSHVSFQLRSQWTGYQSTFDGSGGAPNTQAVTLSIPVLGNLSGIGFLGINDNLGPVNNMSFVFPVSYQFEIGYGSLRIGLMPGVYSQVQKFDELRFNNPGDPLNIGSRETQVNFNVGAGLVYTTRSDVFIGVSSANITEPSFNYGLDSLENKLVRNYSLIGGFKKTIIRDISFSPTLNVRSDFDSFSFDLSAMVFFGTKAWGGISYRWAEAMVFMFGYSFLPGDKLQLGYALDYVVDEQDAKQPTSQEVILRYNIPDFVLGGRKKVKTPRFTY